MTITSIICQVYIILKKGNRDNLNYYFNFIDICGLKTDIIIFFLKLPSEHQLVVSESACHPYAHLY